MSDALDELSATTFTTREAAAAELEKAKGVVPRARTALLRKKSTPLAPELGPRIGALLPLAKAAGAWPSVNGGVVQHASVAVAPDLAALQFLAAHWRLSEVDLAGACLHGAAISTSDPRLRGGGSMTLHLGTLATGHDVVYGLGYDGSSTWRLVAADGAAREVAGLEAVLGEIEAEALRQGLPTPFSAPAPKKRGRAPGPPVATPGDEVRIYAGAEPFEAELPSIDLYREPRVVVVRPLKKMKALPDDLWLVSREGQLFQLTPGKLSRGSAACFARPVS